MRGGASGLSTAFDLVNLDSVPASSAMEMERRAPPTAAAVSDASARTRSGLPTIDERQFVPREAPAPAPPYADAASAGPSLALQPHTSAVPLPVHLDVDEQAGNATSSASPSTSWSWVSCGPQTSSFGLQLQLELPVLGKIVIPAQVFLYAFLFCVAITILARIDWRQRIAIRRLLLRIGWDKFPALDLFVHVHSVNIFTGPGHNSTTHGAGDKYCVRVLVGKAESWTAESGKGGAIETQLDIRVPQGERKIVVEVWVVSGDASRRSKHRMASRTLDLLETVVARRPFGCIRMEAFALTRKMLADKPGGAATYPPHEYSWKSEAPPPVADAFVSGKVTLSLQYKEDVTKQCSEEITNLERLVEHPVSAPLCAKLMSKHLGVGTASLSTSKKRVFSSSGGNSGLLLAASSASFPSPSSSLPIAEIRMNRSSPDSSSTGAGASMLQVLRTLLEARIKWISRFGISRTKYAGVFQRKTEAGRTKWHFGIFHSEKDRRGSDVAEAIVYCGLMTIAAVVTDPRHPNYVCLRYVKSRKEGESVDLYFRILDSPHWIEAMHLFIELIRKLKGQGADRV
mmetsp:Transcript_14399/g.35971  ORF Transcript_14399/g.35971 Transcript_14399/m.35971 type:complete len:571 (-) Transcript_14399:463-2175(-)|eukprot:CAMPEP_0178998130 /NCGR_PEP_ID=MMETSP0795-20121207/9355_1 /TAXON_ID=88552 /ORGANISM="Amoebophrya sp., Strain Ameob2" /LENGTH=570 /DNA_ID=CAMNT_0020690801 /DNA_START=233 /DNA_END=1945 /DNA_ORIENTATION=-